MSSTDGTGAPGPMKCWTVCHNFARNWPCLWERDGACRRSYTSKRAVFLYLHTHTQKLSMCTVYIYNHIYIYYTNICTYIYILRRHTVITQYDTLYRVSIGPGEGKSSESVSGFGFRVSLVETNSADLSPDHVSRRNSSALFVCTQVPAQTFRAEVASAQ